MQVPLIRLQCGCNSYDWGKKGKDSAAARYAAATPSDTFSIQEDKPYAELWMGTHPSLPSKDLTTGRSLVDLVADNQALMGSDISSKYHNKLPFLFKVLSINKALSIQAHPNKKLAGELHAKDPKNYPDDNHKPEMTLAITPFEGLCGFRPLKEIAHFLSTIPPLRSLVGEEASSSLEKVSSSSSASVDESKTALKTAFSTLMKSDRSVVADKSKDLLSLAESGNITPGPSVNTSDELCELVTRCNSQFPQDIGLFVLFFLNFVKLSPGQAMYLKADDIHAYISGDIIECMASSDNVIRAGFTPKFQDVNTLTDILTYDHDPPEQQLLKPVDYPYVTLNQTAYSSGSDSLLYDPPIEEFSVVRTVLKKDGAKATFEAIAGPSIIICTSGSGKISVGPKTEEIKEGWVYFVGATAEIVLESDSEEIVTFRAFCEIDDSPKQNGH
ncbi:Mannose-6-phosphate isomerase [Exophiala xenobiotica]|uniref:Mannose-6-phosphate isomerase n=1 Tax=Vermiconidia calcicola TaxID=1690605 RepID=A0AAV9Q0H3_9PEZI|nr:Mannose-6-phosphate isomerase [Exophiala xenobiotica]KAK5531445.1 Mannose-6-phosphate isomerase [Vermiconidia calcicola]KAK5544769.1 Mannose-6-phosphate isomerase [Chaetothyriales sp. CCFEE 6169]KAK5218245.1 Mannose-6-phosphate isomerase [Exophiala xenobiotica]KAK5264761.1 Mannose-6-phosphate isomerase [Exophiala xenobiotica]